MIIAVIVFVIIIIFLIYYLFRRTLYNMIDRRIERFQSELIEKQVREIQKYSFPRAIMTSCPTI